MIITHTEAFRILTLPPGTILKLYSHMKTGDEERIVILNTVERRDGKLGEPAFFYFGYTGVFANTGAWGYDKLYIDKPKEWGLQKIEVISLPKHATNWGYKV